MFAPSFCMSAFGIDNDGNFVTGNSGGSPAIRSYVGLSNTLSGQSFTTGSNLNLGTLGFDESGNIVAYHNGTTNNTKKYNLDYSGGVIDQETMVNGSSIQYGGGKMSNGDYINMASTVVYRYNGFSGSQTDSFSLSANEVCGTDGSNIYTKEPNDTDNVKVWDGFTGNQLYTFTRPSTRCSGFAVYQGFLYIASLDTIYKMGNA